MNDKSQPTAIPFIHANWPLNSVGALTTLRQGGHSDAPYDTLNLAAHVGDSIERVNKNREQLRVACGLDKPLLWLDQVHGSRVVSYTQLSEAQQPIAADAVYTDKVGAACAILTADCLPILLASLDGSEVAAIHGGWRSLAEGVVRATAKKFNTKPGRIVAWLGPAIGPKAFEVGAEVRAAMMRLTDQASLAFTSHRQEGKYWCDIYQLATILLEREHISQVFGGGACTVTDQERFFSYRRDGVTGRMASLIWIRK